MPHLLKQERTVFWGYFQPTVVVNDVNYDTPLRVTEYIKYVQSSTYDSHNYLKRLLNVHE